ncbi:thiosulfate dehydrogenase [quinone] large subunit [Pedobacter cryoconitis]|uniref:Thiosulfate dehydrogenase [quinone] large subunit n=1 Tax=Pedobacter cryoconitis TaxID=188932 RepID=A0A7W8YXG9_9SPHI|nr:DoxX family membrane protein [Pedobacter cryoconitis]MBB5623611.1 thiosulfate dehydrogenase [quinone] large subunit [Pedobacter cryoconitis]
MKDINITYLLARLPIGMSLFGHGVVRLPKLTLFSEWMVSSFSKSMLPEALVLPFSYLLPVLELLTGLLLLSGLFSRFAILLGSAIMLALIFGSCMIEQWENVFIQVLYGAYFAVLYRYLDFNKISIDQLIIRK